VFGPPEILECSAELTAHERRRGFLFLRLAVAGVGFALALQMGLNANFLVEEIGVSGLQIGMLEAIRESCGIVAFLLLALLAGFAEPVIGCAMLLIVAVGLSGYTFAPTFGWVVGMSLVWSQGLHVWMPLPRSMALSLAETGRTGHYIGRMGAAGAAGFGSGIAAAYLLSRAGMTIRPMYILAGVMIGLAGLACLNVPRRIQVAGPRLVFRRKYALYYLLNFLEGWRKQIFLCFAAFLLVDRHGTPVTTMLLLIGIVQAIGFLTAPRVGHLIDRVGERPILMLYYACLTCFFVGYATIDSPRILYVLFVADNALFVFAMAQTTYVNRIAPPAEHTATLSMGVAMHHVAAVAMPLVGGILWQTVGYQWTFLIGAAAAIGSIPVVLCLPRRHATGG